MPTTDTSTTGHQVELGRYEVPQGIRVLTGRRIEGVVHVYDFPADHAGRGYFVEKGFETRSELAVLIADYREQARRLGVCPMGPAGLEHLSSAAVLGALESPKRDDARPARVLSV